MSIQQYIQTLIIPLRETFQAVLDVVTEVCNYFNELSSSEQINRPYLITAMQVLIELHEQILPTLNCSIDGRIEVSMNLDEIAQWATRLNTVQQLALSMYSFWVSDVLEEILTEPE